MKVIEVMDGKEKSEISRNILEALPNWFGILESTEEYIDVSRQLPFFVAMDESKPIGFISMKENNKYTAEVYVMGVLPDYHGRGIGKELFNKILQWSKEKGYEFLQVKTLDESHPDIYYKSTRRFYQSLGFKPLECVKELWGKESPCLIMVTYIG